ncbi:hypothetical protein [Streptomyces gossypii]|nr:hypothetical protein [Streptomyces gossypii]
MRIRMPGDHQLAIQLPLPGNRELTDKTVAVTHWQSKQPDALAW